MRGARSSKFLLLSLVPFILSASATRRGPDCAGPGGWAANSTLAALYNAGLLTRDNVDFRNIQSRLILSERVAPGRYRQLFQGIYPRTHGPAVQTLTVSSASWDECSLDQPHIYVVARELS